MIPKCDYIKPDCLPFLVKGQQFFSHFSVWGFPGGTVVKTMPANAEDVRDACSIPGLGRSQEMATQFSILVWKIPQTEEPGGYSLWGHKESDNH